MHDSTKSVQIAAAAYTNLPYVATVDKHRRNAPAFAGLHVVAGLLYLSTMDSSVEPAYAAAAICRLVCKISLQVMSLSLATDRTTIGTIGIAIPQGPVQAA